MQLPNDLTISYLFVCEQWVNRSTDSIFFMPLNAWIEDLFSPSIQSVSTEGLGFTDLRSPLIGPRIGLAAH